MPMKQGSAFAGYLKFREMGGTGVVHCADCSHEVQVTSFMHGYTDNGDPSCNEGYQCETCGRFASVHRLGNPPVTPVPPCECGASLVRHRALFCPKCRSKNLRYGAGVIS